MDVFSGRFRTGLGVVWALLSTVSTRPRSREVPRGAEFAWRVISILHLQVLIITLGRFRDQ